MDSGLGSLAKGSTNLNKIISSAIHQNSRNEYIFQNSRIKSAQLHFLIACRSFTWCCSSNILNEHSRGDWFSNPIRATKNLYTHFLLSLRESRDFYGFTDGSWKFVNNRIISGIGGFLSNKKGDTIFLFSGHSVATNPLQAEIIALVHMLGCVVSKFQSDKNIAIYIDSKELKHNVQQFRAGRTSTIQYAENVNFNDFKHIDIVYMDRNYNTGADYLAKQGSKRSNIIMGWFEDIS